MGRRHHRAELATTLRREGGGGSMTIIARGDCVVVSSRRGSDVAGLLSFSSLSSRFGDVVGQRMRRCGHILVGLAWLDWLDTAWLDRTCFMELRGASDDVLGW